MIYLVVVKFFVFVSEEVSIFSTNSHLDYWGGGQKDTFAPQLNYWGACPGCSPKSTPTYIPTCIYKCVHVSRTEAEMHGHSSYLTMYNVVHYVEIQLKPTLTCIMHIGYL